MTPKRSKSWNGVTLQRKEWKRPQKLGQGNRFSKLWIFEQQRPPYTWNPHHNSIWETKKLQSWTTRFVTLIYKELYAHCADFWLHVIIPSSVLWMNRTSSPYPKHTDSSENIQIALTYKMMLRSYELGRFKANNYRSGWKEEFINRRRSPSQYRLLHARSYLGGVHI